MKKYFTVKNLLLSVGVISFMWVANSVISYYSHGYGYMYSEYTKKDNTCNAIVVNFLPKVKKEFIVEEIVKNRTKDINRYRDYELGKKGVGVFEKVGILITYYGGIQGMESYYKECFGV